MSAFEGIVPRYMINGKYPLSTVSLLCLEKGKDDMLMDCDS